jgi:hypothetical protein
MNFSVEKDQDYLVGIAGDPRLWQAALDRDRHAH